MTDFFPRVLKKCVLQFIMADAEGGNGTFIHELRTHFDTVDQDDVDAAVRALIDDGKIWEIHDGYFELKEEA